MKLNEKDYQQLKLVCTFYLDVETTYQCNRMYHRVLVRLLNESRDPVVLAVAVHDVGQYVKHCDRGKQCVFPITAVASLKTYPCRVIEDLGAKRRVMELMSHDNPDVRYQAITSVQRLVSHPWRR